MNLRVSKSGLRFRLGQEEFREFQKSRYLEEVIEVPYGPTLVVRLVLGTSSGFRSTVELFELTVTEDELSVFAIDRITKKTKHSFNVTDQFSVVLEVDIFSDSQKAGKVKETQTQ